MAGSAFIKLSSGYLSLDDVLRWEPAYDEADELVGGVITFAIWKTAPPGLYQEPFGQPDCHEIDHVVRSATQTYVHPHESVPGPGE